MFNWVPKEVEFNKLSVLLTWPPSWMMSKLIPNHRASNFFNYRPRNCMKLTCTYTRLLMMAHMKSESIVSNKKNLLAEWWLPGLPAMHSFFFLNSSISSFYAEYETFLYRGVIMHQPSCISLQTAKYIQWKISLLIQDNHFCIFSSVVLIGKNTFFFLYLLVVCWTYSYLQW